MTDITYMTAVMLSYLNGANIQYKRKSDIDSISSWAYVLRPSWNWMDLDYREGAKDGDDPAANCEV